jgi:hypothetical protein
VAQPRRLLLPPILAFGAAAVLAVVVAVAAIIALVGVVTTFSAQLGPGPSPTPIPRTATPVAESQATAAAPSPEPAAPGQEFVRIANTGGTGAFVREEPRAAARGIVAHGDRTVLKITGPDVVAEGRTWRNVENQQGVRGWTPAEFLVASDVGF